MIFISGCVLGGIAVASIATIFIYLIVKQEKVKKLPVWIYVLAVVTFIVALVAIFLVILGGTQGK